MPVRVLLILYSHLSLQSAGTAGLAGYLYLDRSPSAVPVKPTISDKAALDPQNFLDFKLKKIEPYNYNTAKCVFLLLLILLPILHLNQVHLRTSSQHRLPPPRRLMRRRQVPR